MATQSFNLTQTSTPKPMPDLDEIRRACKVVVSGVERGRTVEVRALRTPRGTCSGYFSNSELIPNVFNLSAEETTPNVYWTIQDLSRLALPLEKENAIESGVRETTGDHQVRRYVYLPIDCDPDRPAGTSATGTEKARAHDVACAIRDFLSIEYGIESILADSGNGYHVLVRIDLAVSDDSITLVHDLLIAFHAKFGTPEVGVDTKVFNPSRILKVYGTVARKGEHTDERPWRISRLLEVPDNLEVVPEERLRALLADLTKDLPTARVAEVRRENAPANPASKDLISEYRNNTLTSIAGTLRHNGLEEDEIYTRLTRINEQRCEPMLPEHEIRSISKSIGKKPAGDPVRDMVIMGGASNPVASIARMEEAQPVEWSTPQEVDSSLLPVMPFSLEFLPHCLRPWATDVSERMSIPLDFAGVSIIAAIAGAIGRRAFVYPKAKDKDWKESIAISGAIIAPSGKLKTPAFKVFMAPFNELEIDWNEEKKKEWANYDRKLADYKAATKVAKTQGVEYIEESPQEPEPARRIMLNDSTPEMAHAIMANNPEGILLYRDEFASWVAELEKEGREAQRGIYLAAMNGNDAHNVDRIDRGSTNAIMCASLYGGFQPELLMEFLNNMRNQHDGLLARFGALCWPDEVWMPLIDRAVDDGAKQVYRGIIYQLAKLKQKSISLHFAPDAQKGFDDWRADHLQTIVTEKHPGKRSHLSKYMGLLPKLAGLLQLADLAGVALKNPQPAVVNLEKGETTQAGVTEDNRLGGSHVIDLGHLQQAIGLLTYFRSHMARIYACVKDENQLAEEALAKHILDGSLKDFRQGRDGEQRGFTSYDIQRNHWAHLKKQYQIEFAIDALEDKAWIRVLPTSAGGKKRGRPTYRWEINPAVKSVKP